MKFRKKIIKAIKEDLKQDMNKIQQIANGNAKIDKESIKEGLGIRNTQDTYKLIIITLTALLLGIFISGQYYQHQCNQHIINTYGRWIYENSNLPPTNQPTPITTLNNIPSMPLKPKFISQPEQNQTQKEQKH